MRRAEGIRIVEPGGNLMIRPNSQSTRWPPLSGSKFPSAVMAHHPNARLKVSLWGHEIVEGPMLKETLVNTDLNQQVSSGLEAKSAFMFSE